MENDKQLSMRDERRSMNEQQSQQSGQERQLKKQKNALKRVFIGAAKLRPLLAVGATHGTASAIESRQELAPQKVAPVPGAIIWLETIPWVKTHG